MFTVDGLISGLDTASIVEGALSLQNSRLDRLNLAKQEVLAEQSAFKTIEGRLLSLQGSLRSILRSTNNAFDKKTATTSDEDAVVATASNKAVRGTYQIQVTSLARAHQIASNAFATTSTEINPGSLTLRVGDRAETTIEIDATNNTWQGLADAINASSADVRAAILDDGSGSAAPFRLLLTANHSGSIHEINVTSQWAAGTGDQPDFSGPPVQDALDAEVQVGNGPGAITVKSPENQFDNLIPGASIDVLVAEPGKDISITIGEDTSQVIDAISGFVKSYNEVVEFIDANATFDPETNSGGLFLGDRTASSVLSTLRGAVTTVVRGVNDHLKTLTSLGISTNAQGQLDLNTSRLRGILDGEVENVGIDDIRRLFAIDGQSDSPGIEFLLGTNRTKASALDPDTGALVPYGVEINRVARQAKIQAASSLLENTIIDATNNSLKLKIDGVQLEVNLPHGTYTRDDLTTQLQTLINTSPDRAGRQSLLELAGDNLVMSSASFGSSSSLRILDGSANVALGFSEGQSADGVDVAGVFRVNLPGGAEPLTEQAVGNGQTLTSDSTNKYTAQLQIRSSLQENQIGAPVDAHITVTRGIGAVLDAAINELLDSSQGRQGVLTTTQDRLGRDIETIDENIGRLETQIETRRESLLREFAALESTLSELQSVGNALSSSLVTRNL